MSELPRDVEIIPLTKVGTNSTMFTMCCRVAITDRELSCPRCRSLVIGHDAPSDHERGHVRWANATRFWGPRHYA